MSIEVIVSDQFSALTQTETTATQQERTCHAVFHSFFLMTENKMLPKLLHTENA